MIDCWPQFSDAVVDYYFTRKLAFHYLKRVHAPVCVMVREPDSWNCGVVASNDSLVPVKGHVRIWDADTDETVLDTAFRVSANENAGIGRIRAPRGVQRLWLIKWESDHGNGVNHYLLGTPPFALERYRAWLPKIAALDGAFAPEAVAK
jgi:beta-mannosidase